MTKRWFEVTGSDRVTVPCPSCGEDNDVAAWDATFDTYVCPACRVRTRRTAWALPSIPTTTPSEEQDPTGRTQHEPGAKLDAGKPRPALVLGGFARALMAVVDVGTYGAVKYTDDGWQEVPDGERRYDDAMMRHWLKEKAGETHDAESELHHASHAAWNALARLEKICRDRGC